MALLIQRLHVQLLYVRHLRAHPRERGGSDAIDGGEVVEGLEVALAEELAVGVLLLGAEAGESDGGGTEDFGGALAGAGEDDGGPDGVATDVLRLSCGEARGEGEEEERWEVGEHGGGQ